MRSSSIPIEAQQIDWAYEARQPWRILLRLMHKGIGFYLGAAVVFTLKHSPLWMMAILPAEVINALASPHTANNDRLVILSVTTVLLLAFNIPLHMFFVRMFSDSTRQLEQSLRLAVARRLQQLSISFHGAFESGRLQSKMLRDVEQVQLMSFDVGTNGLGAIIQLFFVVAYTAVTQPPMLLFFLVITPAAIGISRTFRSVIQSRNTHYRQNLESMNSRVVDMVGMLALARAHAVEEAAINEVSERVSEVNKHGRELDRVNAIFSASTWVTFQFFGVGVLGMGAWFAVHGWIKQPGDIIIYTTLFAQLIFAINTIMNLYPQFARGLESVESLREVLQSPDLEHNEGKAVVRSVKGEIAFEQVSFAYPGSSAHALHDLTLQIPAGITVAIVGASGSGKSTLINCAMGFNRPTSGRILLDGVDMETIDMRTWRQHLSLVPQQIALFNGTVRENILFGLSKVPERLFEQVIHLTHVHEFVSRLPDGVDTVIGESGARLSGGQRQRIAIARALMRNPRVIVLDEPTSALDLESERFVQQALNELTRNRTTIIVAHRLSTIRNANLVCVLSEGRLVESGTHDVLIARGGAFARLHAAGNGDSLIESAA